MARLDATGKTLEEPTKRRSASDAHTQLNPMDEGSRIGKRKNGPP